MVRLREVIRPATMLAFAPLVALLGGFLWIACDGNQPLSRQTATEPHTPASDDLRGISCPPDISPRSRIDVGLADYTRAMERVDEALRATATALHSDVTPSAANPFPLATQIALPPELYEATPAPAPPGSLAALLAPDPVSGRSVPEYTLNSNGLIGSVGYGYFASEDQLDEMGRLCGLYTTLNEFTHGPSEGWGMYINLDLYASSAGANEAFGRWAGELGGSNVDLTDPSLLEGVGNERELRLTKATDNFPHDSYDLLFRRRNVVVELRFIDGQLTKKGPELVVGYAAQLDQNIQAAAAANPATPPQ